MTNSNHNYSEFKLLIISILIIHLIALNGFFFNLSAQASINSVKSETILKESPYSKSQISWIVENGFDAKGYNWDSPAINLHLNKALKKREQGYAWSLISVLSTVVSITAKSGDSGRKKVWYPMAVGSTILSFSKFHMAKKKVSKAQKYRLEYISPSLMEANDNTLSNSSISISNMSVESPYSKNRNAWMMNNGFDVKDYNWSEPEINLQIEKAFRKKTVGNVLLAVGTTTALLGLLAKLISGINSPNGKMEDNSFSEFYLTGGGVVLLSATMHIVALKKLKKAKTLKNQKKF